MALGALHGAVAEAAAVEVTKTQVREALDLLKAEDQITERGGNIALRA